MDAKKQGEKKFERPREEPIGFKSEQGEGMGGKRRQGVKTGEREKLVTIV